MSEPPKFCPNCGNELHGNIICEKCGFDTSKRPPVSKDTAPIIESGADSTEENFIWKSLKEHISEIGYYAWVLMVIDGLWYIGWAIYSIVASFMLSMIYSGYVHVIIPASAIWDIIAGLITIAFALIWVRPKFSIPCRNREFERLLNDVIKLGGIRIPKMLFFGLILTFFTYVWGVSILLFVAIVLIFFSPYAPYQWKVNPSEKNKTA